MSAPLLEARGLRVEYRPRAGGRARRVVALAGLDVALEEGETLALVGESGSGKSSAALALAGLLRPTAGEVRLRTRAGPVVDLAACAEHERRRLRPEIGWVPQDPGATLDPRRSVGHALGEGLAWHRGLRGGALAARVAAALDAVGLPGEHAARFPHQLSGGERQRAALARGLALEPRVLVCDEITSALDVSVQAQVLELLDGLRRARALALLVVSHDLGVVRLVADRVAVLLAGRVVEEARADSLFARPRHPYTRALLDALPGLERRPLPPAPALESLAHAGGCPFAPRCARAEARCRVELPALAPLDGAQVACHVPEP
jgi:oligopeptide/dipeptide ABC transporter ATP-binding protein